MAQTTNIASILDYAATRWPQATALHYRDTSMDFRTLLGHVNALAATLAHEGFGPGDTIALLAPNTPEFVCAYFGILKTGAALLPVNPLMLPKAVAEQMHLCRAGVLFVAPQLDTADLRAALAGFDVRPLRLENYGESVQFETAYLPPDALAVRLFTSGTTGAAKAVGLSHYNLFFNAMQFRDLLECRPGASILASLPLAYGIGQTGVMNAPLMAGAAVVLQPAFNPVEALALIGRHRVTAMIGVPTLYRKMLDVAGQEASSLFSEHWRIACVGGAPVSATLWQEIEARFGPQVVIGYGLSETSPLVCSTQPGTAPTPHLIGQPSLGVDVSVRTPEGHPVAQGESGELWVRGHNVGLGYVVSDGAEPPASFDAEWFQTGDVARMDAGGKVFLLGRLKDIIIRSAHNINPAEVEHLLAQHPAVAAVAVLGIPDAIVGEEIAACIVPPPGHLAESLADEIHAWAKATLPVHAYPRLLRVLESLPLGPTGKVVKAELRTLFGAPEKQ